MKIRVTKAILALSCATLLGSMQVCSAKATKKKNSPKAAKIEAKSVPVPTTVPTPEPKVVVDATPAPSPKPTKTIRITPEMLQNAKTTVAADGSMKRTISLSSVPVGQPTVTAKTTPCPDTCKTDCTVPCPDTCKTTCKVDCKAPGKDTTVTAMKTTPSGLKYKVLKDAPVDAPCPTPGSRVTVHYDGWLLDKVDTDDMFDSSRKRGQKFTFTIGKGHVIKGWDEGVSDMKVGEMRRLEIPSDLAYGSRSMGSKIPANSTLVFDVELFDVA